MKKSFNVYVSLLLALFLTTSFFFEGDCQTEKHLGIATYSVKGLEFDIEGAFKSLQKDRYVVMEISNYNAATGTVAGDYSPVEYAALAEKYGMDIISSHTHAQFDVNDVEGSLAAWGKIFDDHKAMGCKYVIFPMNNWPNTLEGVREGCELMNKIGEEANKRGIKFGYHNHSMEFGMIGDTDQILEDYLIANTDPEKVFFQMDVYWVTMCEANPVEYLQKYPDRFKVLHIKDEYVIGESGKIDFETIFKQFYNNGHLDWFVEIEEQMTEEQRAQIMAMVEEMKERQRQAEEQQGTEGKEDKQAQAETPAGGFPQPSPEQQAQRLETSLEAVSKSAEYLRNAAFVK